MDTSNQLLTTQQKNLPIFILAGSSAQAEYFANKHGLDRHWKYVTDKRHLYGIEKGILFITGTAYSRIDFREIFAHVKARNFIMITDMTREEQYERVSRIALQNLCRRYVD